MVLGASTLDILTLIVAAVAAVSSIVAAVVTALLGKRSEREADRRAIEAETRADNRAKEVARRERLLAAHDQCTKLAQQATNIVQGLALTVARGETAAAAAVRDPLHREYLSLQTEIGRLGEDMNVSGGDEVGPELGVATVALIEALNPGRSEIANVAASERDLLASLDVANSGLATYRVAAGSKLR
jgi:hypothetical protein